MGVSINGGIYPHSWMVYFRENPMNKWMMNRGYPYFRKPPYNI
jgi:hypothetical protein